MINIANKGFKIIKEIDHDSRYGLKIQDMYYDDLFDIIKSEFESLDSITELVMKRKFKDSLIILRSVFEMMLFYWLVIHGKKYRFLQIFTVISNKENTPKKARDETIKKWRKLKKEKNLKFEKVIDMQEEGENKIKVLSEYEGMYERNDIEETGEIIPFYWAVLTDHYNQNVKFNSELPSIKIGKSIDEKRIKENLIKQNTIYSKYIHIDAIIKNLVLNNLISKIEEDHIRVHYNFLSGFTHPTKMRFQFKRNNTPGFLAIDVSDEIITEQIMLYVCKFQYHLLGILLEKIKKYNSKANIEKYISHIETLKKITLDFWFIHDEPTKYDIVQSEQRKRLSKNLTCKNEELTVYYENPLIRLKNMKCWNTRFKNVIH